MIFKTFIFIVLISGFSAAQTTHAPLAELPEGTSNIDFPAVAMVMTTPAGDFPMFLELALTQDQTMRGLMFRPDLPDDYGMLFVFTDDRPRSFWMHNTVSPLDIVYIRSDGIIDSVHQGTPYSQDPLPSDGPARFVLEVRQGLAQSYGLEPGASVAFK